MAVSHAQSGDVLNLPLGDALAGAKTSTLVKTKSLELLRLVLPAGKSIASHQAPGEITVQCLEGRVAFSVGDAVHELSAGRLLYLAAGVPHALTAHEPSSLLVTLLLPNKKPSKKLDVVQQASEESFPASDAPAWFIRSDRGSAME